MLKSSVSTNSGTIDSEVLWGGNKKNTTQQDCRNNFWHMQPCRCNGKILSILYKRWDDIMNIYTDIHSTTKNLYPNCQKKTLIVQVWCCFMISLVHALLLKGQYKVGQESRQWQAWNLLVFCKWSYFDIKSRRNSSIKITLLEENKQWDKIWGNVSWVKR